MNSQFNQLIVTVAKGFAVSLILNIILYFIFNSWATFPPHVLLPFVNIPFSIFPIFLWTISISLMALGLLIYSYRKYNDPLGNFNQLALLLLATLFVSPTIITYAPLPMIIALDIMNICTIIILISTVNRSLK